MAPRARGPRSSNPLVIAASAVTRSLESSSPSRLTTQRLLAEALLLFRDATDTAVAARQRRATQVSNPAISPAQIQSDTTIIQAYDSGARALVSAAVGTLLTLPAIAGALRRRAVQLIRLAAEPAGAATMLQQAERSRAHVQALRRGGAATSSSGSEDIQFASAVLTLAEVSAVPVAGRVVAKESINFLLNLRISNRSSSSSCMQSDVALAIAHILQSFPAHFSAEPALLDASLTFALGTKQSASVAPARTGNALLISVIAPSLTSRNASQLDRLVMQSMNYCHRARASDRGAWAIAVARLTVIARSVRIGEKLPSTNVFSAAAVYIARLAGLADARAGCALCLAAVLRMWAKAMPETSAAIAAKVIGIVAQEVKTVAAASALRDAIVYGVLHVIEPSLAHAAVERLETAASSMNVGLCKAVALDVAGTLVRMFGEQSVVYDEHDPSSLGQRLISAAHDAVGTNFSVFRLAGIRLIAAIASAFPRLRVPLITTVLQNLRIADLSLENVSASAADDVPTADGEEVQTPSSAAASNLSAILGNAGALALLIEGLHNNGSHELPSSLLRKCASDCVTLLTPFPFKKGAPRLTTVSTMIRRRAAWGVLAAMARISVLGRSVDGGVTALLRYFRQDLGQTRSNAPPGATNRTEGGVPLSASGSANAVQDGRSSASLTSPLHTPFDSIIAASTTRSAALSALAACLAHENCTQLHDLAPSLIGACAARVVAARESLSDPAAQAALVPSAAQSATSKSYGDTVHPQSSPASSSANPAHASSPAAAKANYLSRLWMAESVHIVRCIALIPPRGNCGELCYYVAVSCGEHAQKSLGDAVGVPSTGGAVSQLLSPFSKPIVDQAFMAHRKLSLSSLYAHDWDSTSNSTRRPFNAWANSFEKSRAHRGNDCWKALPSSSSGDQGWVFGTEGMETPVAEEALVASAEAIASVVVTDLVASGAVLKSLSSASNLSPTFNAAIALAIARRVSQTDLEENGRALVVLQLLVSRALTCTATVQDQSSAVTSKDSVPEGYSNGMSVVDPDLPGSSLQKLVKATPWFRWTRSFAMGDSLTSMVYTDEQSRSLGIIFASRALTAEAYRELAKKGGTRMWIGLAQKVTSSLLENLHGKSASQITLAATCATVLGSLLDVMVCKEAKAVPASNPNIRSQSSVSLADSKNTVDQASQKAVEALAEAIDIGQPYVQVAAASALSDTSSHVAINSERLMAALSHAWSLDCGGDGSPALLGRSSAQAGFWSSSLDRIGNGMVSDKSQKSSSNMNPFLLIDSAGYSSTSPALAIGAAAVLASCSVHKWEFRESSALAASELCSELVHWTGNSSMAAHSAGICGLTEMWAARISTGQVETAVGEKPRSPGLLSLGKRKPDCKTLRGCVPINFFSIRDPSQAGSSAGLYLEDVLYGALCSGPHGIRAGVQMAALTAVELLLRESGLEAVCASFPRLPENLFVAVQDGLVECQPVLEYMASKDSRRRPRYWIGLCRAVGLGGSRLNTGTSDSVWDANLNTRRLALRITRIAVTCSLANCACLVEGNESPGKTVAESEASVASNHVCALGCLKETLSYVLSALRVEPVDDLIAEEVCGLLQIVSSVFLDKGSLACAGPKATAAFQTSWTLVSSTLCRLLSQENSPAVQCSASQAAVHLLLTAPLISTDEISDKAVDLLGAVLGTNLPGGLRALPSRFSYDRGAEPVAASTILSRLADIGFVVAVRAAQVNTSSLHLLDSALKSHASLLKALLLGAVGDCVVSQDPNAAALVCTRGGAVVPPGVPFEILTRLTAKYVGTICVGANALAHVPLVKEVTTSIGWCCRTAPSVLLLGNQKHAAQQVALAELLGAEYADRCATCWSVRNITGSVALSAMTAMVEGP